MGMRRGWDITREAVSDWLAHGAMMHAAALSFYTMVSLAPMVVLVLAVAGVVWGEEAAEGRLVEQTEEMLGEEAGQAIETIVQEADDPGVRNISALLGLLMAAVGATGVFAQLQTSLNTVWGVQRKSGALKGVLRTRLIGFGLVLLIGLLLLASMVLSAVVTSLMAYAQDVVPWLPPWLAYAADAVVSLVVIAVLLGLTFKSLPDVELAWRDVAVGAVVSAVLFVIGKTLIGMYLGMAGVGTAYGAAGSLVVLLVWIYYSALIVLLGAEFTQVYVRRVGGGVRPAPYAERVQQVTGSEAARQEEEN